MSDASTPNPSAILQIGFGFWPARTLLTAVELGLFTVLAEGQLTGEQIEARLGFGSRATYDFLDANAPAYIGGILEMAGARLYPFWGGLGEALRTGEPQNEVKHTGKSMFAELYADPARLEQFMRAMSGISAGNFHALAEKFDFAPYSTVCDVGGATGQLAIILAQHHPHLRATSFDLPVVVPIAERTIAAAKITDRVEAVGGDFFADPLPKADVITMGMILHDWNLDRKLQLIRQVYDALPDGGVFIAVENLIDDDRRENVFGLMMSLNMLIEFGDAFDFTGADFRGWCEEVGFRSVEVIHLAGPCSAAIARK